MLCNQSTYFEVHWAFLYLIFSHSTVNILCFVQSMSDKASHLTWATRVPGTPGAASEGAELCSFCRGLRKVMESFAWAVVGCLQVQQHLLGQVTHPAVSYPDFIQVWSSPLHWDYFCWRLVAVGSDPSPKEVKLELSTNICSCGWGVL